MLENDTLWGGTYLYGLYMGVPPFPSPGCRSYIMQHSDWLSYYQAFGDTLLEAKRASSKKRQLNLVHKAVEITKQEYNWGICCVKVY